MAPEYAMDRQISIKSDVFSFGVLVLEIIAGRRNRGSYEHDLDVNLLGYVSTVAASNTFFFSKIAGRIMSGKYIDREEETVKVQVKSPKKQHKKTTDRPK